MSDVRHTPGPWVVFLEDRVAFAVMSAGRDGDICKMDNPNFPEFGKADEMNVNAALIAAAPDLLAACELFDKWVTGLAAIQGDIVPAVEAARAAIAKARAG